jgi:hypothetical protein
VSTDLGLSYRVKPLVQDLAVFQQFGTHCRLVIAVPKSILPKPVISYIECFIQGALLMFHSFNQNIYRVVSSLQLSAIGP